MKENPLTYLLNIETESRLERSCLVGSAGCFKIVFVNTIPILMDGDAGRVNGFGCPCGSGRVRSGVGRTNPASVVYNVGR